EHGSHGSAAAERERIGIVDADVPCRLATIAPMRLRVLPILAIAAGLAGCGPEPAPASAAPAAPASQADAPGDAPPTQLGLCASCHGRDGIAVMANTPDLAGRDRDDLLAAMQAYLDG